MEWNTCLFLSIYDNFKNNYYPDGTSTVTFLPYIGGMFIKEYIIPNYIGESLAALIPSVLSLAQGATQEAICQNETFFNETSNANYTNLVPFPIQPNYPVSTFFILMFILLVVSTASFTYLNYSKYAIKHRKQNAIGTKRLLQTAPYLAVNQKNDECIEIKNFIEENKTDSNTNEIKREKIILFLYIFMISFLAYGFLPGLQTYSTLPYGNHVFNLAVNLSKPKFCWK